MTTLVVNEVKRIVPEIGDHWRVIGKMLSANLLRIGFVYRQTSGTWPTIS
jgi:hypothetical protein